MPYTNLGTKRHRHREHLFEGNIQYKGCGTKRTMVEASNMFFFLFNLLFIRLSTEVFALDRWKCIHVLDPYTITHWLKEGRDILKDTHRTFKRTCYHLFFFSPLTKIDTASPALKFHLNKYKIMSCLFTVR